ncbi:putative spermidine/putrescine transport system permease protein [Devosia sp. YR412]|uniref:ABC transporter permease subunit n=2 Tax=Pseudomonadota TaxID=1224 RepID=UPI0008C86571|nr:ABC transporter permease subunit [Devosia sp. YR412]SEQ54020.1 putative spermidine/putrescine transport system permease protein [Devosia sp. YR412]
MADTTSPLPMRQATGPTDKRRFSLDSISLAAPGGLFLIVMLAIPTLSLIGLSFQNMDGAFSLSVYEQMFGAKIYVDVLLNTFGIGFQATVLCLLFGYPVAYWLSRLEDRPRRLAMWFVLLPFWTGALLKNFSWIVLLARNGIVNSVLQSMGMEAPADLLYQRATVIFAVAHTMMPLAIMTMLPSMLSVDRTLVPASRTLGAKPMQSFWRVFFPLSMPGATAAGLLVFVSSIGFFVTPQLLGGPRDTVIGQLLITQVTQMLNWRLAGAIATMLLAVTLIFCLVYDRLFGISSVTGGTSAKISTGPARDFGNRVIALVAYIVTAISEAFAKVLGGYRFGWLLPAMAVITMLVLLVPVVAFIPMAFGESSFLQFPPTGLSMRWMETYFTSPIWIDATIRSFYIALACAVLTGLIAGMGGYGVARSTGKLGGVAFMGFMLPMIVPNIVIAVSLAYFFANIGLLATDIGIILGHVVVSLPVVFIIVLTTFKAHDWRLDQAASTLGANRFQVLRHITLPLCKGGLVAGFLFGFLHSFDELTIAMFVGGGLRQTLPKQMWDDVILSVSPTLAAASLVVLLVVTVLFVLAEVARPRA